MSFTIIFLVIFIALAFEYINGFHDTANSIATVVGTKVLTPRQAILMAATTNLFGALVGHAVAKTVSSGLVDSHFISPQVIICALLGAIVWNLLTWLLGLPSSSTHALVGGLCGAAVAHQTILATESARLFPKLPVLGPLAAGTHTDWQKALTNEMRAATTAGKNPLVAAAGQVHDLSPDVPVWIKVLCSLTMAAGTAAGGWRIIRTLGHKLVKLQPVHGFAAETTAATLLAVTGYYGMTVSTTHSITTSIMGVGCARRFNALQLSLVERIIWAWILTLPAAGGVAYLLVKGGQLCGWIA